MGREAEEKRVTGERRPEGRLHRQGESKEEGLEGSAETRMGGGGGGEAEEAKEEAIDRWERSRRGCRDTNRVRKEGGGDAEGARDGWGRGVQSGRLTTQSRTLPSCCDCAGPECGGRMGATEA